MYNINERLKKERDIPVFSFSCFLLLTVLSFAAGKEDWELKKDENGIKVYTRLSEGSNLKEVRVVNEVHSSLSAIVALLLDTKNYPSWIYACSEAQTLKLVNDKEQYQYTVTDVPWPVSDRDVVSYFKIEQNAPTGIVTMTNSGMADYIPEKSGRVRVQHFQSKYTLTPAEDGIVKVEFELYLDPGGSVPAWLINANIVTAPYNTTVSMSKQLPNYQTASYSFIKEK
jgi:hypothetical protein